MYTVEDMIRDLQAVEDKKQELMDYETGYLVIGILISEDSRGVVYVERDI
jgi:hypothetical protein